MAKSKNTAFRLGEYMDATGLKQIDILRRAEKYCKKYNAKLTKSDLSQYCNGKTEPNQEKLYILSLAMGVSVTWLMGYDVPMRATTPAKAEQDGREFARQLISDRDREAIHDFLELQETDKLMVIGMIDRLKTAPKE